VAYREFDPKTIQVMIDFWNFYSKGIMLQHNSQSTSKNEQISTNKENRSLLPAHRLIAYDFKDRSAKAEQS
jgi:hypothetical protein